MTLTLTFPPDVETRLRERAAAAGKDVEALVREAVEEKLSGTTGAGAGTADKVTPTLRDLIGLLGSSSAPGDGWAEGVEEAMRLGNQPVLPESPWGS